MSGPLILTPLPMHLLKKRRREDKTSSLQLTVRAVVSLRVCKNLPAVRVIGHRSSVIGHRSSGVYDRFPGCGAERSGVIVYSRPLPVPSVPRAEYLERAEILEGDPDLATSRSRSKLLAGMPMPMPAPGAWAASPVRLDDWDGRGVAVLE